MEATVLRRLVFDNWSAAFFDQRSLERRVFHMLTAGFDHFGLANRRLTLG